MTAARLYFDPVDVAVYGAHRGFARLRERFAGYVEARSRSIAIRELERLGDATLADLGYNRARLIEQVRNRRMPWS